MVLDILFLMNDEYQDQERQREQSLEKELKSLEVQFIRSDIEDSTDCCRITPHKETNLPEFLATFLF